MSHHRIRPIISIFTKYPRQNPLPHHHYRILLSTNLNSPFPRTLPTTTTRNTTSISNHNPARGNHNPMARPLTDAERARAQAHLDAMREAMGAIESFDPERVREAREAVMAAHPIDDSLRAAYAAEQLRGEAEPLAGIEAALACPLLREGARPWGAVVYRVAYGDEYDVAWRRMLELIGSAVREALLEVRDRPDLLQRHQLVVMDDRARFEGASSGAVRDGIGIIWMMSRRRVVGGWITMRARGTTFACWSTTYVWSRLIRCPTPW
jgi:hypothetical protein